MAQRLFNSLQAPGWDVFLNIGLLSEICPDSVMNECFCELGLQCQHLHVCKLEVFVGTH